MKTSPEMQRLQLEINSFLTTESVIPPDRLTTEILSRVNKDLNPSRRLTFTKLMLIHLGTLGLTLLFCPQLGLGPVGGGSGVMGWVMPYGTHFCACFCGSFLFGTTAVLGQLLLTTEECRVVYRTKLWQFPALTAGSLFFLMLSRNLLFGFSFLPSLDYLAVWFLAGIGGALFFSPRYKK